jgi:hypothetical protein
MNKNSNLAHPWKAIERSEATPGGAAGGKRRKQKKEKTNGN